MKSSSKKPQFPFDENVNMMNNSLGIQSNEQPQSKKVVAEKPPSSFQNSDIPKPKKKVTPAPHNFEFKDLSRFSSSEKQKQSNQTGANSTSLFSPPRQLKDLEASYNNNNNNIPGNLSFESNLHSSGGARLKDLCVEDQAQIGQLIKQLAKEKEEQQRVQNLFEKTKSLYKDGIKQMKEQSHSFLNESQDLQEKYFYSLELLQKYQEMASTVQNSVQETLPNYSQAFVGKSANDDDIFGNSPNFKSLLQVQPGQTLNQLQTKESRESQDLNLLSLDEVEKSQNEIVQKLADKETKTLSEISLLKSELQKLTCSLQKIDINNEKKKTISPLQIAREQEMLLQTSNDSIHDLRNMTTVSEPFKSINYLSSQDSQTRFSPSKSYQYNDYLAAEQNQQNQFLAQSPETAHHSVTNRYTQRLNPLFTVNESSNKKNSISKYSNFAFQQENDQDQEEEINNDQIAYKFNQQAQVNQESERTIQQSDRSQKLKKTANFKEDHAFRQSGNKRDEKPYYQNDDDQEQEQEDEDEELEIAKQWLNLKKDKISEMKEQIVNEKLQMSYSSSNSFYQQKEQSYMDMPQQHDNYLKHQNDQNKSQNSFDQPQTRSILQNKQKRPESADFQNNSGLLLNRVEGRPNAMLKPEIINPDELSQADCQRINSYLDRKLSHLKKSDEKDQSSSDYGNSSNQSPLDPKSASQKQTASQKTNQKHHENNHYTGTSLSSHSNKPSANSTGNSESLISYNLSFNETSPFKASNNQSNNTLEMSNNNSYFQASAKEYENIRIYQEEEEKEVDQSDREEAHNHQYTNQNQRGDYFNNLTNIKPQSSASSSLQQSYQYGGGVGVSQQLVEFQTFRNNQNPIISGLPVRQAQTPSEKNLNNSNYSMNGNSLNETPQPQKLQIKSIDMPDQDMIPNQIINDDFNNEYEGFSDGGYYNHQNVQQLNPSQQQYLNNQLQQISPQNDSDTKFQKQKANSVNDNFRTLETLNSAKSNQNRKINATNFDVSEPFGRQSKLKETLLRMDDQQLLQLFSNLKNPSAQFVPHVSNHSESDFNDSNKIRIHVLQTEEPALLNGQSPQINDETLQINHLDQQGLSLNLNSQNSSQQNMGMILKSNITTPSLSNNSRNQFYNQFSIQNKNSHNNSSQGSHQHDAFGIDQFKNLDVHMSHDNPTFPSSHRNNQNKNQDTIDGSLQGSHFNSQKANFDMDDFQFNDDFYEQSLFEVVQSIENPHVYKNNNNNYYSGNSYE